VALADDLQHAGLAFVGRGERDVPAFALQRHPASRLVAGQQPGNAEPGARAQQRDRRIGHRRAAADLTALVRREVGQRERQRGEVVDHDEALEAQRLLDRRDRERPVAVRQPHRVARDGGRDADRAPRRRRAVQVLQVVAHRVGQARVVGDGQRLDVAQRGGGAVLPGEAGVGAADVGQQPGQGVGRAHGKRNHRVSRDPECAAFRGSFSPSQAMRCCVAASNRCSCDADQARCTFSPTLFGTVPGRRATSGPIAVSTKA